MCTRIREYTYSSRRLSNNKFSFQPCGRGILKSCSAVNPRFVSPIGKSSWYGRGTRATDSSLDRGSNKS